MTTLTTMVIVNTRPPPQPPLQPPPPPQPPAPRPKPRLDDSDVKGTTAMMMTTATRYRHITRAMIPVMFVCWLLALCPNHVPVYLMGGSAQTSVLAATLR